MASDTKGRSKRLGLNIGGMSARNCARICQAAEESGNVDFAWTYEILGRDAFTVLASMGLATQKIQLATGLVNLYIRTPTVTAMSALSIDELSNGRMNLGLGVSFEQALKRRHSIKGERPFQYLKESIEVIRGISLSPEGFSYSGEIFQFSNFKLGYKPVRSRVPIFVGAHNPKMLEFAGEFADGVLLNALTKVEVEFFVRHIRMGAERAGRRLEDIEIASFFNCCASESAEVRMDELRKRMGWFLVMPHVLHRMHRTKFSSEARRAEELIASGEEGRVTEVASDEMIEAMCIADPPERILERVEEFRELGISQPVLFPTPIKGDTERGYEEILKIL